MLELVKADPAAYRKKYEYIVIELLDQMTRKKYGGEMQKYWDDPEKDEEYIKIRTGYPETGEYIENKYIVFIKKGIQILNCVLEKFKIWRIFKVGRFMHVGEIHQWMYDSYSLSRKLEEAGFGCIKVLEYNKSNIPCWEKWGLEVNIDGSEYKPNSLYIEAVKS